MEKSKEMRKMYAWRDGGDDGCDDRAFSVKDSDISSGKRAWNMAASLASGQHHGIHLVILQASQVMMHWC
jgi:hypothetical protein